MPYVVFALKWRPDKFDSIVGQDRIVNTLKNALQKNRLANAYLFAGPRGVGKTSTARILAKALNCKEGPTVTPCGKCSACVDITRGNSFDVIEIDGASNTGVDEIRQLRENVKFAPASGKFKVYIIDEVHMLSQGAFNALLKTLEEPPEFVKFIFATTHPDKIPSTVLSRCQRLDFRRISLMETIEQLEKICKAEGIGVDKEVLFAIAKSSDGSLRDAESILDQLSSISKGNVSLGDVNSVLGLIEQDVLFGMTDTMINKDPKKALGLLDAIIDEGKDIGIFLSSLIEHFRNLMVAKVAGPESELIDLPKDICDRLTQQAQTLTLDEIFVAFNTLVNTKEMSKRLESIRIPLEIALIKLTRSSKPAAEKAHVKETVPPVASVPMKETPAPAPAPAPKKHHVPAHHTEPESTVSIPMERIGQAWQGIIDKVGKVRMSVATYLNEGEPVKCEKGALTVAFPKDYSLHKESIETKDNRTLIENALHEAFPEAKLIVRFTLTDEVRHKTKTDDPVIKSALEMFGGRVINEE